MEAENQGIPADVVLIIDDDHDFCDDLTLVLGGDFKVLALHDGQAALDQVGELRPDVILLDLEFQPGQLPGLEVLEKLLALDDPPPVIMLSGNRDLNVVVQAIKMGAFHYVNKASGLHDLHNLLGQAMASRRHRLTILAQQSEVKRLMGNFIARDPVTHRVLEKVAQVAATPVNVLITGESGTGKEMVARRIHALSGVSGPFVGINCATVKGDLINSEVFGHVKGSFTGADSDHIGMIELATGGTLFLDEVGESSLDFQARLLRALGEKVYMRQGGHREIKVRTRILAATSKKLSEAMARGEFREDLYYRLNHFRIHVPPLRERPGDIMALAEAFLMKCAAELKKDVHGFSDGVKERLQAESWRGNVRELHSLVERAVIETRGKIIGLGDMFQVEEPDNSISLPYDKAKNLVVERWQREYVSERMRESGGNVSEAAKRAEMPRQSLQRLLRSLNLDPDEFRG